MNDNLDKDGLIKVISDKTEYTIKDTRRFLNALIETFGECLINEQDIDVRGWGHMYIQTIPARRGYVPIKGKRGEGEFKDFPEAKRVIFKLAKNLRDMTKYEEVEEGEEEEIT